MTEEQLIKDLIKQGESEQLEFKEVVHLESLAKTLCGFSNGKGGRILVGVSDSGEILGLSNANASVEQIRVFMLSAIVPEIPVTIGVEKVDGKDLLMMKVYGGSKQPYIFDGSIYYRKGVSTVKASSKQIPELIYDRQSSELHWERQPAIGVSLEDLDQKLILSTIKGSEKNHRSNYSGNDVLDFLSYYGLYQ